MCVCGGGGRVCVRVRACVCLCGSTLARAASGTICTHGSPRASFQEDRQGEGMSEGDGGEDIGERDGREDTGERDGGRGSIDRMMEDLRERGGEIR